MKFLLPICLSLIAFIKSDAQSISLVKSIPFAQSPFGINEYESCNGDLYFTNNNQLWKTSGDSANTVMLKQFSPNVYSLTCFKGKLFFVAADSSNGYELWTTDGTTQGTVMVKHIGPANSSGIGSTQSADVQRLLTEYNGKLYFIGNDYIHGAELWSSDGTAAGTSMVTDYKAGQGGSIAFPPYVVNNKLFYPGGVDSSRFVVSDGTPAGTHTLHNAMHMQGFSMPSSILVYGGRSYFAGVCKDSTSTDYGKWGLMASDGTDTGTTFLKEGLHYLLPDYAILSGKLIFISYANGVGGYHLYTTDGTKQGTQLLYGGLNLGFSTNLRSFLTTYNNKVYFSASDFVGINSNQLWETDGSPQGTKKFTNLQPYPNPTMLTVANGRLYFKAAGAGSVDIWSTDGTLMNTQPIPYGNTTFSNTVPWSVFGALNSPIYQHKNYLFFENIYDTTEKISLYKYRLWADNVPGLSSSAGETLLVYPNPTTTFIKTSLAEKERVLIYDMTGRIVAQTESGTIDVSFLSPGTYILVVGKELKMRRTRFTKI